MSSTRVWEKCVGPSETTSAVCPQRSSWGTVLIRVALGLEELLKMLPKSYLRGNQPIDFQGYAPNQTLN